MSGETIAKALGGRKVGSAWMARCPAHDDREPSLSITDTKDGMVLVRCHAGCNQSYVFRPDFCLMAAIYAISSTA
jgi:putative DNA primase/helicase